MLRSLVAILSGALATLAIVLFADDNWGTPRDDAWTVSPVEHVLNGRRAKEEVRVTFRLRNPSAMPLRILGASTC